MFEEEGLELWGSAGRWLGGPWVTPLLLNLPGWIFAPLHICSSLQSSVTPRWLSGVTGRGNLPNVNLKGL